MPKLHPFIVFCLLIAPALWTGGILSYAGDSSDGVRLGFLSLLGWALFYYALRWQSKIFYLFTALWWFIFFLDSTSRALSWFLFNSDPSAYFIIQAIANTSIAESIEFLQIHTQTALSVTIGLLILSSIYFFIVFKYITLQDLTTLWHQRIYRYLIIFIMLVTIACYAMRPSRALFPVLYWHDYAQKVQTFKNSIQAHATLHQQWAQRAKQQLEFESGFQEKQTHVLILSESVTSLNLSVCGYPRTTTPELAKHIHELKVFCNAYSPYSSTISSLRASLTDSSVLDPLTEPSESILSYAKAAGFKTFWISNQDDSYISSLFGTTADVTFYNNKRSGRSSSALDQELFPHYLKALQDPEEKKLIVLHFIGAHPNYANRYPTQFERFKADSNDAVEHDLQQRNIGLWVQLKRNEYDNAILYQDWLIKQFFQALQQHSAPYRSFTFISDHGNEVGHSIDYAGHSPTTPAGYQIPVIVWYDGIKNTGVDKHTILDSSDLDTNLMDIMKIRDKSDAKIPSWLDSDYQFQPNSAWPYWEQKHQ